METPEPPDFEQMSKEELIAFAMPLEEVDLRRRFSAVQLSAPFTQIWFNSRAGMSLCSSAYGE